MLVPPTDALYSLALSSASSSSSLSKKASSASAETGKEYSPEEDSADVTTSSKIAGNGSHRHAQRDDEDDRIEEIGEEEEEVEVEVEVEVEGSGNFQRSMGQTVGGVWMPQIGKYALYVLYELYGMLVKIKALLSQTVIS